MYVLDEGRGPAVLLCHGFCEAAHAWRHQIDALANAGFRAIAPDMRGYGLTESPVEIDEYTVFHMIGDMIALLDALEVRHAVIVGSDWGATIAWQAARLRPDRFRGVVALGVPMMASTPRMPTSYFPESDDALFYVRYFQHPGVAEAELEADADLTMRRLLFGASGDAGPRGEDDRTPNPFGMVSRANGLLAALPDPEPLPPWLPRPALDALVSSYRASGFRGGLNYYRNLDRNWQLLAAFDGVPVMVPARFLIGERDPGLSIPGMRDIISEMPRLVPNLQASRILTEAGHWLQQERPLDVNEEVIRFAQQDS
jgi:pimeloyl-ACP methyl ester carboxylesterase